MRDIGIFFSKDRREEVIEVEEEPEMVLLPGLNEKVPLMTQGQWMKGCPEGGEQSFLFGLYQQLSEGECRCPHGCGASIQRKKSDFYALFVSSLFALACYLVLTFLSQRSLSTSNTWNPLPPERAPDAQKHSVLRAAIHPTQPMRSFLVLSRSAIHFFIAPYSKAPSLVWDLRCLRRHSWTTP